MPKLVRTGIKRDKERMYYIKDGAVWSTPMKRKGKKVAGKKTKEVKFADKGDLDYGKNMYFVDGAGDVAYVPRGRKKKAKSKK